jgi:O-antigen ligase
MSDSEVAREGSVRALRTPLRRRVPAAVGQANGGSIASTAQVPTTAPKWDVLQVTLSAMILTYVWRIQDLYPVLATLQLPSVASVAAYLTFAFDRTPQRALRNVGHPVTTVLCVLMLLAVLSVPFSLYRGLSFDFLRNDLIKNFVLFCLVAASVRHFADLRRFAAVTVLGASIYALYVFLYIPIGESGRLANLVYYDANDLGMLLVATLPLALFFVARGNGFIAKSAAAGAIVLFILMAIKSGSRGAFLGLIAVALYFLFRFKGVSTKVRVTVIAVGACFMLIKGGQEYWTMMGTMLNPKSDYNWSGNSESGRMDVWKRGVGYMLHRPVTGVGISAFPVAEGTISSLAERQSFGLGLKWSAAHNSFIQIGAELGVLGLLAFIVLLYRAYRTARADTSTRDRQSDCDLFGVALAGSLVGYIVTGFWLSQAYAAFTFVLLALIVARARLMSNAAGAPGEVQQTLNRSGWRSRRTAWARGF